MCGQLACGVRYARKYDNFSGTDSIVLKRLQCTGNPPNPYLMALGAHRTISRALLCAVVIVSKLEVSDHLPSRMFPIVFSRGGV